MEEDVAGYVVRISGKRTDGRPFNGTGFLVGPAGHVATCAHVVAGAAEIRVHLPYPYARNEPALYDVLAAREGDDLALLRSRVPLERAIPRAALHPNWRADTNKQDAVTVWGFSGAEHYAAPQSLACTISGFSGARGHIGLNGDINPGDSGAPVTDASGRVIGIVDLKDRERDGQAMAIPVALLLDLIAENGVAVDETKRDEGPPLPALSPHFTGREADVARVIEQLDNARIVTLTGLGGIGKSETAKAAAHAAQGSDWAAEGVRYVDVQTATDANAVLGLLVLGLGLQPAASAEAVARQLGGHRLYVLDDVHQALGDRKGVQVLVRALHDHAAPAHFLITCREPVGVPGLERHVSLERLAPPHDADLFGKLAAFHGYAERAGDAARREELLRGLDGYPLALTLAASGLEDGGTLESVLRRWQSRRTAALRVPGIEDDELDRLSSMDFSLALSFDRLPADSPARRLFALFADLPAGATEEMLDSVMGEEGSEAARLLVRRSLLQIRDERFFMLTPVSEFAARTATDQGKTLREKLDDYLLALAQHWCQDDNVFIPRLGEALALLSAELPNLHAAMDRAQVRTDHWYTATLSVAVCRFYTFALPGMEAKQRLRDGADAAHIVGNVWCQANCIHNLGEVHQRLSEYEQARARYEQALSLYQSIGSELGEANCIRSLANVHRMLGEYEQAHARYEQVLPLYRSIGDRLGEANCIRNLGDVHGMLGEMEQARACYEQALPLFQSIGDKLGEANSVKSLGEVHNKLSEYEQARARYEQALPLYRSISDKLGEANCIRNLGEVHQRLGEYEQARPCYEQALSLSQSISDKLGEANCIRNLGDVHGMLGEMEQARACYEQALSLYRRIGSKLGEASSVKSLGDVHGLLGEYEQAHARYKQALSLYRSIGSKQGEANCIQSLGYMHGMLGEMEQARARYEQALSLFQSIGDHYSVAVMFFRMGHLCASEGNREAAIGWMEQAAQGFEEIGIAQYANAARERAEVWRQEFPVA